MTADEFYKLGNEYRRKGDWQHALDNYLEAIVLDPQSPAVEASCGIVCPDGCITVYRKKMED